jgi:hypothetical protein
MRFGRELRGAGGLLAGSISSAVGARATGPFGAAEPQEPQHALIFGPVAHAADQGHMAGAITARHDANSSRDLTMAFRDD